jgi:hypothetical protein
VAFDEVGLQGSGGAEAPTPVQNETGHDASSNPAGEPQTPECAPCLHEIIMRASSGMDTHVRQIG